MCRFAVVPDSGDSPWQYEETDRNAMLTQIRTNIGCSECLEEVRQALVALPNVASVEEHASSGDFIVSHTGDRQSLEQVVLETGHELVEAGNGEIEMVPASVSLSDACPHGMVTQ